MIHRQIEKDLKNDFFKGKVILILGARQVGKSTLTRYISESFSESTLWFDGDDAEVALLFQNPTRTRLEQIVGPNKIVVFDEAQKINNIGTILKLMVDYLPNVQVLASGSSAFELKNILNEPLTGRKFNYALFPLSFVEMSLHKGLVEEVRNLPLRLVYGAYPEILTQKENPERLLKTLAESYLYKDIFLFRGIKKPEKMLELLRLLAWQIGSDVNLSELSNHLKIDIQTIESYIAMLEQSYVVYRLRSYHTIQRNELKKSRKIYFNDLGIRNALINDFRHLELRNDQGALFENYMINEINKQNEYLQIDANMYFWRTSDQKEVDLILEKNGMLYAFEFKWSASKKSNMTKSFSNKYPNHLFFDVNKENYFDFLNKEFFEKTFSIPK